MGNIPILIFAISLKYNIADHFRGSVLKRSTLLED